VRHAHEELGHFGIKRTYSLFLGQYWWHVMHTNVQQLVSCCMICDRVKSSFNALHYSYTPCLLWVGLSLEFGLCKTITH
jgi:hypothetical protein